MSARRHLEPVRAAASTPAAPSMVVQLTTAELRAVVADEVRRALAERDVTPANDPATDWIDGDEAARIVGVSRDYLRRVRGLERYGSRRSPRYSRREVEAFVRSRAGRPLNACDDSNR